MKSIVEPKQHIVTLWGKQRIREDETYRLMRYVLRVDHEGEVLLHNVVTGQLVVLDVDEADLLDRLPLKYCNAMEQLVGGHFLVANQFDEHQQVVKMRKVLNKLDEEQNKHGITNYTILPTTACNAHCYYCYQHGMQSETMSMQTAKDVVKFIKRSCEGNRVWIRWFGGEPTLAVHLIDQICEDLNANSIDFLSRITTNGYLMDKDLIEKMKFAWHLEQVMISLDGSEMSYNQTKAFVGVHDNPYRRVLRNVGLLLEQDVYVLLRMNFDNKNYWDFSNLLKDVEREFGNSPLLQVRPHHIIQREKGTDLNELREYEQWCSEMIVDLNEMSRSKGLFHKNYDLPCLKYKVCLAASDDAVVILPNGSLVSCPDLLGSEQVKGDIWQGIVDKEKVLSWKEFGDYKRCEHCLFFPKCAIALNCGGGDSCIHLKEYIHQLRNTVIGLHHSVS